MRCENILRVVPMTTFLDQKSNTLLYSTENTTAERGRVPKAALESSRRGLSENVPFYTGRPLRC